MKKLTKEKTLSEKAYAVLCEMIAKMKPGENRLPSEDDLARLMGISRATVREALKYLIINGVTTTIHGKGTFAHPSVFSVRNRIDLCSDFMLMLSEQYDDLTVDTDWMEGAAPSQLYQDVFGDSVPGMTSGWTYRAAGKVMLYGYFEFCSDYLVKSVKAGKPCTSLLQFSRQYMQKPIDYCTMTARMGCNAAANAALQLDPDQMLLRWDEKIYNIDDNVVATGIIYVHPTNMELSVVTRFAV